MHTRVVNFIADTFAWMRQSFARFNSSNTPVASGQLSRFYATVMFLGLAAAPAAATGFAQNYGGTLGATAQISALKADSSGSEYVAGSFTGATLNLGAVTLTRVGITDAFIAKLDSSGNVLWAKNYGGAGAYAFGQALATDGAGNIFLGGYFQSGNLTTLALTKIGVQDAFLVKQDSSGNVLWSKNYGGTGSYAYGQALATDGAGNIFLGGYFQSGNLTTLALTKIGVQDAFLVKQDSSGNVLWSKNYGGTGAYAYGQALASDSAGNVYLGGYFQSANLSTPALTKIGTGDAFAFKLIGATGGTTSAKNYGGAGAYAFGQALAADSVGNVYLGGYFYGANLTTPALTKIGNQDALILTPTNGVSYSGNGSTAGTAPSDLKGYWSGETATVLGNTGALLKTGSTFSGWNTAADGSGTTYLAGDLLVMGASNVTLYAKWTINNSVTFNSNGGSAVSPQNVPYNTTAIAPTAPTRVGFIFLDWYSDVGLTTTFSFATAITADLTLYAKWKAVVLDIDGNHSYDAKTDGLILLRYLFGFTGNALTANALGLNATRTDPAEILLYLDQIRPLLNIDRNPTIDAPTDGLLIIRHLLGLTGNALTQGAIGTGATRTDATDITNYIQALMQ